jgi:dolichol-phosphate mannosyltransferase
MVGAVAATATALLMGSHQAHGEGFAVWVAIAGAAFLGMLVAHRRWSGLTLGGVVAAGTALGAAALAVPPRATGDLWMYAIYGRMAAHRLNPWTALPAVLPNDALKHLAGRRWMHTPSMYGPVMVGIERVLSPVAGGSLLLTRLGYQSLALAAVAACAVVLWRRTRSVGAVAFLVINPAVVLHLVNGGRNDALVGLAMLVAVLLVADGHDALPGIVMALAVLVKLTAGIGIVAIVAWLFVNRGRAPAVRAAIAAGVVVVAGTVLAGPSSLLVPFRRAGQIFSSGSGWQLLGWAGISNPASRVAVALAAGVMGVVLVRHLRGSPALAVAAALAAWTIALPYLLTGYLGWTLATAALERRSRVAAVVAVQSVVLAVGYAALRNPLGGGSHVVTDIFVALMPLVALAGVIVLLFDSPGGRTSRGVPPAGPPSPGGATDPTDPEAVVDAGDEPSVLVVVPTYNEADNIEPVLRRLRAALPLADVLVIDDGSPDGTGARAEALAVELGRIEVLERAGPSGLGTAYREGFRIAIARGYDVVCEMDADLSHEPESMAALVAAVAGGADLAIGSRYVPGGRVVNWPVRRQVLSRAGGLYARVLLGLPVHDVTAGFRAYRTTLLRRVSLADVRTSGYGFQIELTYRTAAAGGRITEVPITFLERVAGASKMSGAIVTEALLVVATLALQRLRRHPVPAPASVPTTAGHSAHRSARRSVPRSRSTATTATRVPAPGRSGVPASTLARQ